MSEVSNRRAVKVEANQLLQRTLPEMGAYKVVFTRDEKITIPDGSHGCFAVYWGNGAQFNDTAGLCPTARAVPQIVDCYGEDEETADKMFELLLSVVQDNALRFGTVRRVEEQPLYLENNATDAVRATILWQYVS